METKTEINELKNRFSKEYKPIKSPIVQLIQHFKNGRERKRLEEIEILKFKIQKAKLEKELKEI